MMSPPLISCDLTMRGRPIRRSRDLTMRGRPIRRSRTRKIPTETQRILFWVYDSALAIHLSDF
ncbi:hypothetical protein MACH17_21660 [Phaeobacter inhibens]|nr:hypothetical protein MACH17_21660 [Phaeobacter inhibens]